MKLRLENGQCTLRLKLAQAEELLACGELRQSMMFANAARIHYGICLDKTCSVSLQTQAIQFTISKTQLEILLSKPSKDGLQWQYHQDNEIGRASIQIDLPKCM